MDFRLTVVGGANLDIGARAFAPLLEGDSNPGRVHVSPGGVARNIAENARTMGLKVELISAFGRDANGQILADDLRAKGIGIGGSIFSGEHRTATYVYIADEKGDMRLAVNDMEIVSLLTPAFLASRLELLRGADAVALDANLPEESIGFLAENVDAPLFADGVSAAKVRRLVPAFPRLTCLKVNRLEAQALTGIGIFSDEDAQRAARALTRRGVSRVFLTLGSRGAVCAEGDRAEILPAFDADFRDATGAGDAFAAGLIYAYAQKCSCADACRTALAAAAIAGSAEGAVNGALTADHIRAMLDNGKYL